MVVHSKGNEVKFKQLGNGLYARTPSAYLNHLTRTSINDSDEFKE